jgi:transketolase
MPKRRQAANSLRILAADAVEKAQSGHPGMPMGMADIAEVLWNRFLKHNPKNPHWLNRDRFVLSNGHGSMLLYALLHLTGYDVSIADIKNFRQLHSKTPGHPEFSITPGVETTTGPLGQGLANAVGIAAAEKHLAATYNQSDCNIIDYNTYCFLGDGCLMEGISHEACSLAGTWQLGKLIAFWDDNGISIDGDVKGWFTDNTKQRFLSYNWQVLEVDGHNPEAIEQAIVSAQQNTAQPTLICCKTTIGHGSPNMANTAKIHGSPIGDAECEQMRNNLDWPHASFHVPDSIYELWDCQQRGAEAESDWNDALAKYSAQHPLLAASLKNLQQKALPANWDAIVSDLIKQAKAKGDIATRKASGLCIAELCKALPELIGGSADVSGSVNTIYKDAKTFSAQHPSGNYIYYGVREFAMCAIANGLALSGLRPFVGMYVVFSDYARNAIRLAALMGLPNIFILSHDSIALGEDGPTHQPIEQIASLRLIPNLNVWRPADCTETAVAWTEAVASNTANALILSRQTLPAIANDIAIESIKQGGYCILEHSDAVATIIATGSEVALALEVAANSADKIRVVSMPCLEVFLQTSDDYQAEVLKQLPIFAIEAGAADNWYRFTRSALDVFAMHSFGESAPGDVLYKHFGFDAEIIGEKISNRIKIYSK